MFQIPFRRKLKEHGWLWTIKKGANPSKSRQRIKNESIQAIEDLTLVAKIIPESEFNDVFNEENIKKFLNAIFYKDNREAYQYFAYNAELASVLVEIGVGVCISKYKIDNYETPNTAKPVIDELTHTIEMCKEIGHKSKMERIRHETDSKFICMLDEVEIDGSRFDDYLVNEFKITPFFEKRVHQKEINPLQKEYFINLDHLGNPEDYNIGAVNLRLDFHKSPGTCMLYFGSKGNKIQRELSILKRGDKYILQQTKKKGRIDNE